MFSLVFLFSLSFATTIECLQTLFHSGHLDTMHLSMPVFAVGCAHALVWVVTFFLIGGMQKRFGEMGLETWGTRNVGEYLTIEVQIILT